MFDDLDIAKTSSYEQHLNQYDVIYIDMTYVKQFSNDYANVTEYLPEKITEELCLAYPDLSVSYEFPATLMNVTAMTGNKFIIIIDEWDAPIRENPDIEKRWRN